MAFLPTNEHSTSSPGYILDPQMSYDGYRHGVRRSRSDETAKYLNYVEAVPAPPELYAEWLRRAGQNILGNALESSINYQKEIPLLMPFGLKASPSITELHEYYERNNRQNPNCIWLATAKKIDFAPSLCGSSAYNLIVAEEITDLSGLWNTQGVNAGVGHSVLMFLGINGDTVTAGLDSVRVRLFNGVDPTRQLDDVSINRLLQTADIRPKFIPSGDIDIPGFEDTNKTHKSIEILDAKVCDVFEATTMGIKNYTSAHGINVATTRSTGLVMPSVAIQEGNKSMIVNFDGQEEVYSFSIVDTYPNGEVNTGSGNFMTIVKKDHEYTVLDSRDLQSSLNSEGYLKQVLDAETAVCEYFVRLGELESNVRLFGLRQILAKNVPIDLVSTQQTVHSEGLTFGGFFNTIRQLPKTVASFVAKAQND